MQYRLLIHMNPADLVSRNRLAMALYRTGELDGALEQLEYVLQAEEDNFDALDGVGIVLIRMGRCSEALEYLEKAQGLRDEDLMVHVHLAVARRALGQGELAEEELNRAKGMASGADILSEIDRELALVEPLGGGCE
jgi:Flp pilus assembly protein TadD